MPDLTSVEESVRQLAKELAPVLGYHDYLDGQFHDVLSSVGAYIDPSYKPRSIRTVRGSKREACKRITLYKRKLTVHHPSFFAMFFTDSTYERWYVYTEGDITDFEKLLIPLMKNKESEWVKLLEPWRVDRSRRMAITRKVWDLPLEQTPAQASEAPEPPKPTSPPKKQLKTAPTSQNYSLNLKLLAE